MNIYIYIYIFIYLHIYNYIFIYQEHKSLLHNIWKLYFYYVYHNRELFIEVIKDTSESL